MHRLRHPIRSITEPYGKAGLLVAILALVLALGGTALAAKSLFTKAQEKKIAAIAKKYAGKPGAPGATGPAGPTGPAGAAGKNGTNGKEGPEGPQGEPWTLGGTVPSGKTLTGVWTTHIQDTSVATVPLDAIAISYALPLASAVENAPECGQTGKPECHLHYIKPNGKELVFNPGPEEWEEVTSVHCTGSAAAPKADAGNLCIYAATQGGESLLPTAEALSSPEPKSGALVTFARSSTFSITNGSWAVKAP